MSSSALISFYLNNAEILMNNNIALGALRIAGWWILKTILVPIAAACKGLFDNTFALIDFTSSESVNSFISAFKPVFIGLMSLSLFALGIMLIFNHDKKPKIVNNICLAILCVTCSTLVFQQMNELVVEIKTGIDRISIVNEGEDSSSDGVYDIVSNNLIDLYQIDQVYGLSRINYSENTNVVHPNLSKEAFHLIDYNEVLDPDDEMYSWKDSAAEDILSQKVVLDGNQEAELTEIYNGVLWTSAGNHFYYRYSLQAIPVVLQLVSLIVLYLALSYKCFRLIFELAFGRLMAYLFSAELSGGQRLVKILTFIRDTYIALLLTVCSEKLYYIFSALLSSTSMSAIMQAFLTACLAFIVIDGPNIAEKVLGIDIGLSSASGRVVAMTRFGRWGTRAAGAPARALFGELQIQRQAKRTGRAVQNAMQQNKPGFMEKESQGTNSSEKSEQTRTQKDADGQKETRNAGAAMNYTADNQADMNMESDNRKNGAISGADLHQTSDPDFMENKGTDAGAGAAFMNEDKGYEKDPQQFMDEASPSVLDAHDADAFIENNMEGASDRFMDGNGDVSAPAGAESMSSAAGQQMNGEDGTPGRTGNRIIDKLQGEDKGLEFMRSADAMKGQQKSSLHKRPTQYGGRILNRNPRDIEQRVFSDRSQNHNEEE